MKLFQRYYLAIFCLHLAGGFSYAQDNRTLQTKVADVLTEMPANDTGHLNKLMNEMTSLGEEGISLFITQILPTGQGDDTRVRFALESYSRFLSDNHDKGAKRTFVNTIKKTIISDAHDDIKVFLLRRLEIMADNEDIEFIINQMDQPALTEVAARTLLSTKSPAIEQHLVKKLKTVEGNAKIALIKALGELSSINVGNTLPAELPGSTGELREVVLYAMGRSGNENVYDALFGAAKEAAFSYEQTNAVDAFISLGERAVEINNIALGKRVADAVRDNCTKEEQLHFRSRGINILSNTLTATTFNKILLKEFNSENSSYRGALLNHALNLEGEAITKTWSKVFIKAPNEAKIELLGMLFRRGDPSALPLLNKTLVYDNVEVMNELVRTRAKLGGKESIGGIIEAMADERIAEAGKMALLSVIDIDDLGNLKSVMNNLPAASKAAIVDIIGARRGKEYYMDIESLLSDDSQAVRESSYRALKNVVGPDNTDALNQLYSNVDGDQARFISDALVAALQQIENEEERYSKTIEVINSSPSPGKALFFTPEIGGAPVRNRVLEAFSKGEHKDAAFDAICRWPDGSVAVDIFKICENGSGEERKKAFEGYLRLSALGSVPADQKLLMLRKIMPLAKDKEEKNRVIRTLANVRTFPALVYAAPFMDVEDLKYQASRAVMNICLPQPEDQTGLTGKLVEDALKKAMEVMSGPESQYMKEDVRVYLRQMPKTAGFVSMFNGQDLAGWKGYVDNPINVAKMKPAELAAKQKIADGALSKNWSVKNGHIAFTGEGHNLLSVKEYGDFEMYCDWKISRDGDSGIYLRGSPQVQIWDASRTGTETEVGSGGLFNNKENPDKPLVVADNPTGEWNTFYIKMIGEKVTVILNGITVVDDVVLENYWDREQSIFPTGTIELQAHGTDLEFRDIYVREISSPDFSITPDEKAEGFVSLFNGKDLSGWQGNKTDYVVENGTIAIYPKGGSHGNLMTEKEYTNFSFRFDFQLTEGANNGIGVHMPTTGDAAYGGKEFQVLDNTAPIYANLHDYQYHGSLYGVMPAKRGHLKPVGEWNTEEILVQGNKVKVTLNGVVILEGDYEAASKNGTLDKKDHPGLQKKTGHMGFLGHGTVVRFRNIRIKEM